MNQQKQDKLIEVLLDGLTFDGAHHKQYYLGAALKIILGESEYAALYDQFAWKEGVPA